jgi:hypothetical protein
VKKKALGAAKVTSANLGRVVTRKGFIQRRRRQAAFKYLRQASHGRIVARSWWLCGESSPADCGQGARAIAVTVMVVVEVESHKRAAWDSKGKSEMPLGHNQKLGAGCPALPLLPFPLTMPGFIHQRETLANSGRHSSRPTNNGTAGGQGCPKDCMCSGA